MLYNIHFIATSNIASPLEMAECMRKMLHGVHNDGIEVWDCILKENVLIVPWILAFQGDNPMASEFASHIGMSGTKFCRVCHARSPDAASKSTNDGMKQSLKDFITVSTDFVINNQLTYRISSLDN